jgi:hypothetical protein
MGGRKILQAPSIISENLDRWMGSNKRGSGVFQKDFRFRKKRSNSASQNSNPENNEDSASLNRSLFSRSNSRRSRSSSAKGRKVG